MKRVTDEDSDSGRTALTEAFGDPAVAVNRYRLTPGGRFSTGLHAHLDQSELFVVVGGEATFEVPTSAPDSRSGERESGALETGSGSVESERVTVGEGELVRFDPGEYQSGWNDADRPLEAYAFGVPRDSTAFRVPVPCADCGRGATRPALRDGREVLVCPACGAESDAACPACGAEELGATVADGEVVSACRACGTETSV